MSFDPRLIALARRAASTEALDEALVCAVVEQDGLESLGNAL
jgi:hypothetical protein